MIAVEGKMEGPIAHLSSPSTSLSGSYVYRLYRLCSLASSHTSLTAVIWWLAYAHLRLYHNVPSSNSHEQPSWSRTDCIHAWRLYVFST